MDQELPETEPTALFGYDNNILLTSLGRLVLLGLAPLIKLATILPVSVKAIHILLLHLIFVIKESYQEVSFLPHGLDMVPQLTPVCLGSCRLLSIVLAVLKLMALLLTVIIS